VSLNFDPVTFTYKHDIDRVRMNKYRLSLTNHATRCITANVLQTKVNAQCNKLGPS